MCVDTELEAVERLDRLVEGALVLLFVLLAVGASLLTLSRFS